MALCELQSLASNIMLVWRGCPVLRERGEGVSGGEEKELGAKLGLNLDRPALVPKYPFSYTGRGLNARVLDCFSGIPDCVARVVGHLATSGSTWGVVVQIRAGTRTTLGDPGSLDCRCSRWNWGQGRWR